MPPTFYRFFGYNKSMQAMQEPQKAEQRQSLVLDRKTALVIIDVQYRADKWKEWQDETKNIKTLMDEFKAKGLPIIVVSLNYETILKSGWNKKPLELADLQEGIYSKNYARLIPELEEAVKGYGNATFIEKATDNAFDDPRKGLEKTLKEKGVRNAVMVGFNQNVCMKTTVKSSVDLGYNVFTTIETMWGNKHNADVDWMKQQTNEFYGKNTQFLSFGGLLEAIKEIKQPAQGPNKK
jgi:nicotinamidase-related amidase